MPIDPKNSSFLSSSSSSSAPKTTIVGKDLLGYCSKCKMNLMHTVISSDGMKAAKTRCNTCKTERGFKPPKKNAESPGGVMSDREELDLDSPDAAKALLGEAGAAKKKKAKAKAKAKPRVKKEDAKLVIPLSMLDATADDIAMYEAKSAAFKAQGGKAAPYKASVRFATGDAVDHKTFGKGYVVAESGLNKIEVLFETGRKLLVTAPA